MARYLTKSRFKIGLDCPTKLYYTGKSQYPDKRKDDSFLEALAEGGYQVGELAKCYFPGGTEIKDREYEIALEKTNRLLAEDNATIYEAAFRFDNLFIRADIIVKKSNHIDLYEVKAKSYSGSDSSDMLGAKGYLSSGWHEYLYDVAFQKFVISNAFKDCTVRAHMIFADKTSIATVNGLNQKFQLKKIEGERKVVEIFGGTTKADLGEEILIAVDVDDIVERIWEGEECKEKPEIGFEENIWLLSGIYDRDERTFTPISSNCKDCEFDFTIEEQSEGKLSGFRECWKHQLNWDDKNFEEPLMFKLWNYRRKQAQIEEGVYYLRDIQQEHLGDLIPCENGSLSTAERQWIQIQKVANADSTPYIDTAGLKREFSSFVFPLHFIDFETSMVAIPFYKGRRPYEQTAFQFSHHTVSSDFKIEHKGQYLCVEKGKFPNFDFIRHLKTELEQDNGSVFRYANHENTVLNQILAQLESVSVEEVSDKQELIEFIKTITHGTNHRGPRDMIDMLELVKKYYYHPLMGGSNSLKYVLPAVLNSSDYIQKKYSQPIYGKNSEVKSLNFDDGWTWLKKDGNGEILSPYKLLPPLFQNIEDDVIEDFFMRSDIQDGGAAMTAYAKMQFTEITDREREFITAGILKYCELDTLAMVLIWEYWKSEIDKRINP
jgi:hypothetical protein